MNHRLSRRERGFTLIELMITVAIVGILAAIAYPSYKESVAKGKRTQAKAVLSSAQQWMERNYSESYSYSKTSNNTAIDNADGGLFKTQFGVAPPASEGTAAYNLTVDTTGTSTYVITATRTGGMAGDRCGDFTINSTGRKAVVNHSGFGSGGVADLEASRKCWGG